MLEILLLMEIEEIGILKVEFYLNIVLNIVFNFMNYVNKNFYDGLIFYCIIKGFMI